MSGSKTSQASQNVNHDFMAKQLALRNIEWMGGVCEIYGCSFDAKLSWKKFFFLKKYLFFTKYTLFAEKKCFYMEKRFYNEKFFY